MSKQNRQLVTGWIIMVVLFATFWTSIVTAIIGKNAMCILSTIIYCINNIVLERKLYSKEYGLKRSLVLILAMDAVVILPCVLIILVRSVIG